MVKRSAGMAAVVVALIAAAVMPASAGAVVPAPAWEVFPVVGPTNLYATTGQRDEVQTVSVSSSESNTFTLSFEGDTTAEVACNASPAVLQAALEALSGIGPGGVDVSTVTSQFGASCGEYSVTFAGPLANKPLRIMTGSSNVAVHIETPGRGGWGKLAVYVVNVGGAPSTGTINVTVNLPAGVTTYETPEGTDPYPSTSEGPGMWDPGWTCTKGAGLSVVTCSDEQISYPGLGFGREEFFGKAGMIPIDIPLHVENTTAGEVTAEIAVNGGGAAPLTVQQPITVSPTPAGPGLQLMKSHAYEADGSYATQAAGHPYSITTAFFVRTTLDEEGHIVPADEIKNVETSLPPGFIGNPNAVPKCDTHGTVSECFNQSDTQVGVTATMIGEAGEEGFGHEGVPSALWSLVPEAATPAEFGFYVLIVPIRLSAKVRSDGDYGVTVSSLDTLQTRKVYGSIVTFWGKPNESMHDELRCPYLMFGLLFECKESKSPNTPFLTDSSDCVQQAQAVPDVTMELSFWQDPEKFSSPLSSRLVPVSGCDKVPFHPSLHVTPTQHTAASPTGLTTELHMPQVDSAQGIAEADVQKAVVTLPEGMTISPAAAGGLSACSEAQIGLASKNPTRFDKMAPTCPDSSKLGTVTIDTPLLPNPLKGNIYLAEQENNPFGSLLAVYLYVNDPVSGIEVKVAGRIDPDPVTGRITATFDDLPQLAWGDVKLTFKQGPRAPLMTPTTCGTFAATSDLTPTSMAGTGPHGEAIPGGPDVVSSDSVTIEGCHPPAFAPSFVAGTTNNQAAAFSPFTMTLSRNSDEEATPRTISMTMPAGLSGMLSTVPLCGESQARGGTCSTASQVGHVTVIFGDGPNPLTLPDAGKGEDPVYLTGPYEGAPFGLAIVVPAEAGPFNLGKVVVRARVIVDPHTARITVVSDPMPTILRGVPTDLRTVNVQIDRGQFTLNPTGCKQMSVAGQIGSTQGANTEVESRFQVANCSTLAFKPQFTASTSGKTSRRNGASLNVKLTYPKDSLGKDANIAKVKVELPKQLPSRLSTLQQACPDSTFNTNPAACPAGSRVGAAKATTPILPVPLTGPAYFVSHGGQKWPELIVVLQGYGVTVDLAGETFISKGITSSTFATVPDVPVQSFQLSLPQGANSALAANGNLCIAKLRMPTVFTGQNGKVIRKVTPIVPAGCAKHKRHHKRHKHKKHKKRK